MASTTNSDCYAAVDIGASSGRVVIGTVNEGHIELTEIHRFDNIQKRINGHDCWDIDMLFRETVAGLAKCKEAGFTPKTIGIDTWGVDFVLLDEQDALIGEAVAYRDERTNGMYSIADRIMRLMPYIAEQAFNANLSIPSISFLPLSLNILSSLNKQKAS